jgi:hypothetical protein
MARKESQVALRLDTTLVARADALAEKLQDDPQHADYQVTRASVMRQAMREGLTLLEQRHTGKRRPKLQRQLTNEIVAAFNGFVARHRSTSVADAREAMELAQAAIVGWLRDREP